jgi:uncharacterized protein (UPF0128 family)
MINEYLVLFGCFVYRYFGGTDENNQPVRLSHTHTFVHMSKTLQRVVTIFLDTGVVQQALLFR